MEYPGSKRLENHRKKLPPLQFPIKNVTFFDSSKQSTSGLVATDLQIVEYYSSNLRINLSKQQKKALKDHCPVSLQQKKTFLLDNYIREHKFDNYGYKNNCLEHIEHLYKLGISLTNEQRKSLRLPNKIPYFERERQLLNQNFLTIIEHSLAKKTQQESHSNANGNTLKWYKWYKWYV